VTACRELERWKSLSLFCYTFSSYSRLLSMGFRLKSI
jgi:hypothetical protein